MVNMLPSEWPPDEIIVHQLAANWRVLRRDQPEDIFDMLEPALMRALELFRESRYHPKRIIVLPPDSPFMWE